MNLEKNTFENVILGAVFFDPNTGLKFQKVDEHTPDGSNRYGQEFNAVGDGKRKQFTGNSNIKVHKNHIKTNG